MIPSARKLRRHALAALAFLAIGAAPARAQEEPVREAALPAALPPLDLPQPEENATGSLIGQVQVYTARYEDTLPDLAKQFDVGFVELKAANPTVDTWLPGAGTQIIIPSAHILPEAPRKGLVINVPEMRIYFFAPDGSVQTYPIGIGRDGWETPTGTTSVVRKTKNPVWTPPASIRKEKPWLPVSVPSGPDNPLGYRALYLGWAGYLIHGTNTPYGVGRRASHGCIRLYEPDIEKLYPEVKVGTRVTSVSQEVKAAWIGDQLYVEIHPSIDQALEIEGAMPMVPALPENMVAAVLKVAPDSSRVDWDALQRAGLERRGYPVRISR